MDIFYQGNHQIPIKLRWGKSEKRWSATEYARSQLMGKKVALAILTSLYVVLCLILAPILNSVKSDENTRSLKFLTYGYF